MKVMGETMPVLCYLSICAFGFTVSTILYTQITEDVQQETQRMQAALQSQFMQRQTAKETPYAIISVTGSIQMYKF